jgi:D-serine deaminase-like pyridoxal phosphate-dependent protein
MSWYRLTNPDAVFSPALLFYPARIRDNIAAVVRMGRDPSRLRPHVKTHKTREIVRLQLEAGITRFKCATIAEAEMTASSGAPDVMLAYSLVGPNGARMAALMRKYPSTRFSALIDHPGATESLSTVMERAGLKLDVLMDLDVGQHRTGIAPGEGAMALWESLARLPGLNPVGFHVYDGHNHQESLAEREASVAKLMEPVLALRRTLEKKGLPVRRIVAGGTPTFPVYARMDVPGLECSPGTCFLNDHGYGTRFQDLSEFQVAAVLLTRVVSKPSPTRLTLDLGTKSVASDPPAGKRCRLLNVTEYEPVIHNEEHFVIETPSAGEFAPGDVIYAVPTHICPTSALHRSAHTVENGRVTGSWDIVGRDRVIGV